MLIADEVIMDVVTNEVVMGVLTGSCAASLACCCASSLVACLLRSVVVAGFIHLVALFNCFSMLLLGSTTFHISRFADIISYPYHLLPS